MKLFAFLPIAIAAISGCTEPAAPYRDLGTSDFVIARVAGQYSIAPITGGLAAPPAVRVYRSVSQTPVAGWRVSFTFRSHQKETGTVTVLTDASGIAQPPEWRVGPETGQYYVTAFVEGTNLQAGFTTYVRGQIVSIFDLKEIDGIPVSQAGPRFKEGHIVLFQDRTFNLFYDRPAESALHEIAIGGFYRLSDEAIDFLSPPWLDALYAGYNGRMLRGVWAGNSIIVNRISVDDELEWGPELYELRKPGA